MLLRTLSLNSPFAEASKTPDTPPVPDALAHKAPIRMRGEGGYGPRQIAINLERRLEVRVISISGGVKRFGGICFGVDTRFGVQRRIFPPLLMFLLPSVALQTKGCFTNWPQRLMDSTTSPR